ncbi:hypothetical protein BGW37DRAFT_259419 [Umbelopsis sp. PMI_123]|nr:hypothetical protein BGW37DRAFT_259419 [Umbelopsis sp. PMI_123]
MRLVPLLLLCALSQVLAQSVSTPAAASSASSAASSSTVPSSSAPAAASSGSSVITTASSAANTASAGSAAASTAAAAGSQTSWSIAQPLSTPSTGILIPPAPSAADIIRHPSIAYLAATCAFFMIVA